MGFRNFSHSNSPQPVQELTFTLPGILPMPDRPGPPPELGGDRAPTMEVDARQDADRDALARWEDDGGRPRD